MTDPTVEPPPHIEHRIETPDGRTLAVAEWGDPNGLPLFALHGTPGTRLSYWEDPTIYARHGLRRLTYDRPGYGDSTRHRGRVVADAVVDVVTIAEALGVDRFAVSGGSGGGPHALAIAAVLPDRVIRCLAAVSVAPWEAEGLDWLAGMTPGNVEEFEAAAKGEEAYRAVVDRERETTLAKIEAGHTNPLGDSYELSDSDKAQLERHAALVADNMFRSVKYGTDGWVDDGIAFTKPWGFSVETINVPVYLTYGRTDTLVPAAHGDWLAAHIPNVEVHAMEGSGHMGDDDLVEKQHAWLAGGAS